MKDFLLDKCLLENNKGIEGIESFSDSLSLVSQSYHQKKKFFNFWFYFFKLRTLQATVL